MWKHPLVHHLVLRCFVAGPYRSWFVAQTKTLLPHIVVGYLTLPTLNHVQFASIVRLHLPLSRESQYPGSPHFLTVRILSYCVLCLYKTVHYKTSLIPYVMPLRVMPKSNIGISWACDTVMILTWHLGSAKDTSLGLCLFT
jgi:hypothetical protein